jgi:hypothetical protein
MRIDITEHGIIPCPETMNRLTVVAFVAGIRKQTDMASALNCGCQNALMFGASTGLAARANLPLFSDQAAKDFRLFIINSKVLISTELTHFGAGIISAFTALIHIIFIA